MKGDTPKVVAGCHNLRTLSHGNKKELRVFL